MTERGEQPRKIPVVVQPERSQEIMLQVGMEAQVERVKGMTDGVHNHSAHEQIQGVVGPGVLPLEKAECNRPQSVHQQVSRYEHVHIPTRKTRRVPKDELPPKGRESLVKPCVPFFDEVEKLECVDGQKNDHEPARKGHWPVSHKGEPISISNAKWDYENQDGRPHQPVDYKTDDRVAYQRNRRGAVVPGQDLLRIVRIHSIRLYIC